MEYTTPLFYAVCLVVLYEVEENISIPTTVRLLENALCQQYFANDGMRNDIGESRCKIQPIQSKLAYVRGWHGLFRNIPGLVLGFYFSGLANKYGRRHIYAFNMIGMMMEIVSVYAICHFWNIFPIELIWATSIFHALGGGIFIILALHMTIVSDLSTEDNRSQNIYKAFTLKYIADLIGPQVASVTLQHSLWLPNLICWSLFAVSLPILLLLPETRPVKEPTAVSSENETSHLAQHRSYADLFKDWRVFICISIVFLTQYRYLNAEVLVSYISVCFHWEIGQVARLLSIIPGVSFIIFVSLSRVTTILQKNGYMSLARINLLITHSSLFTLVLGGAIIAGATNIPTLILGLSIFSAGNGIRAPLLATASTYSKGPSETSRLYTLLSLTDSFSHMLGAPLIQTVWSQALELGGRWLPLPFLVTLIFFTAALGLSLFLQEVSSADKVKANDETQRLLLEDPLEGPLAS